MKKHIVISDPFPRTLDLIFSKKKLRELKSKYKLITAPKLNKKDFYEKNIHKATFIIGQPELDIVSLLRLLERCVGFFVVSDVLGQPPALDHHLRDV